MTKSKMLIDAINHRKVIEFSYDGLHRKVEPYIFGTFIHERTELMAYQIAGQSKSGNVPAWKNFRIEKIQSLIVTDETFTQDRFDYNPQDQRFKKIFAKID